MLSTSITTRLFIDHLVLTIQDLNRSVIFYSAIFGEPLPNDKFDPKRIGLEHFAIGIDSEVRESLLICHL